MFQFYFFLLFNAILLLERMIVRTNNLQSSRSHSRIKGDQHRSLLTRISDLQQENKGLRAELLLLEERLEEAEIAKRKYKTKYREAKQKLEILTIVNRQKQPNYDLCHSPRTKATRMKTFSSEDFNSIKVGHPSEFGEHVETKVQIDHFHPLPPNISKPPTSPSLQKQAARRNDEQKIMQNLLNLHKQLEKLSQQIEGKSCVQQQVTQLEDHLYRKMQEIIDKVAKMEARDIQRENRRIAHEKEVAIRRYNASAKSIESIGKDLADFKVSP